MIDYKIDLLNHSIKVCSTVEVMINMQLSSGTNRKAGQCFLIKLVAGKNKGIQIAITILRSSLNKVNDCNIFVMHDLDKCLKHQNSFFLCTAALYQVLLCSTCTLMGLRFTRSLQILSFVSIIYLNVSSLLKFSHEICSQPLQCLSVMFYEF